MGHKEGNKVFTTVYSHTYRKVTCKLTQILLQHWSFFFFFPKLFVFKFLNLSKPNPVQKNFCSSSRDTRAVSGKCKKKINKKNCTLIHMKWLDSKLKRGCFRANDVTKLLTIIKEKLSKPLRQKQIRQNKVRILLYDLKHAPYKNDGWKHENTCIRKGWKWTDCSIFQSL